MLLEPEDPDEPDVFEEPDEPDDFDEPDELDEPDKLDELDELDELFELDEPDEFDEPDVPEEPDVLDIVGILVEDPPPIRISFSSSRRLMSSSSSAFSFSRRSICASGLLPSVAFFSGNVIILKESPNASKNMPAATKIMPNTDSAFLLPDAFFLLCISAIVSTSFHYGCIRKPYCKYNIAVLFFQDKFYCFYIIYALY